MSTNTSWGDGAAAWRARSWSLPASSGATASLDVGCGTGVLTLALAEHGAKAVGIDASEPYLGGARRHRPHPEVTYELADARHIPYEDDSFDGCVSILALDVIPEVDQVVQEMRRVS